MCAQTTRQKLKKPIRNTKRNTVTFFSDSISYWEGLWPLSNSTDWHWKCWIALVPSKLSAEAEVVIWLWLLASRPPKLAACCGVAHWLSSSLAIRQPLRWFLGSPALLTGKQIDCSIFARKAAGPVCFVPALDETKYWQAGISCGIKILFPGQLQLLLYALV